MSRRADHRATAGAWAARPLAGCALGAGPDRPVACSRTRASPDTRTLSATQIRRLAGGGCWRFLAGNP